MNAMGVATRDIKLRGQAVSSTLTALKKDLISACHGFGHWALGFGFLSFERSPGATVQCPYYYDSSVGVESGRRRMYHRSAVVCVTGCRLPNAEC